MGQYYKPCIITIRDGKVVVLAWLYPRNFGSGIKILEHSYLGDDLVAAFEWLISPDGPYHKAQVVWTGDNGEIEPDCGTTLYDACTNENHAADPQGSGNDYPIIVNHTKRCYIDKNEVEGDNHPLPLLTMGGVCDYAGCNEHLIGIWARDVISVEKEAPEGFEEVAFKFEF